jgi:hypothetical protein
MASMCLQVSLQVRLLTKCLVTHITGIQTVASMCQLVALQLRLQIYVSSDIQFYPINLKHFNKEKDLEICALKIDLPQKIL